MLSTYDDQDLRRYMDDITWPEWVRFICRTLKFILEIRSASAINVMMHIFLVPQSNWLSVVKRNLHNLSISCQQEMLPILTLLMLEMEYSGFGGQYHACWCTGDFRSQCISEHGIGCVGQTTCIVVPELISSTWVKANPRWFKTWIYFLWSLKQQSMLRIKTQWLVLFTFTYVSDGLGDSESVLV